MNRLIVYSVWMVSRLLILFQISALSAIETDTELYFTYGSSVINGLVPYLDFTMEYPPGVIPFLVLPKLMASDLFSYRLFFMIEIMAFDLLGLVLIEKFGRRQGFSQQFLFSSMMFYLVLPAILFFISFQRYDMIPAALVLLALVLFDRKRSFLAGAVLGLAFAVKLYPIILGPVFLMAAYKRQTFKNDFVYGLSGFAAGAAVTWVPLMLAAGEKFWVFLSYHSQRGVQIESMYASVLGIARWFGLPVSADFSFGSWNLVSEASPLAAKLSLWVMLLLMVVVLVQGARVMTTGEQDDWSYLPRFSLLMIMAFVIGGKVFSPQYLLWMVPLIALAMAEDSRYRKLIWFLFALMTLLTYIIFPLSYNNLVHFGVQAWMVLVLRNGLAAAVFYLLLRNGKTSRAAKNISET